MGKRLALLLLVGCAAPEPPARPGPIGLRLRAGARQDLSLPELGEIAIGFQDASDLLWRMTSGAIRIESVSLEDAVGERPYALVFDRDVKDFPQSPLGMGPAVWRNGYALLHETLHAEFSLPDEYPRDGDERPLCGACIMAGSRGQPALCDATNHRGEGKSCRAILESRFSISKRRHDGPAPDVRVVIRNNGK